MSTYVFSADTSGAITPVARNALASGYLGAFPWNDTDTPPASAVWANPGAYYYNGTAIISRPMMTAVASGSRINITAPFETVTVTAAGSGQTVTLTEGQGTWSYSLDANLAPCTVPVTFEAYPAAPITVELATPGGLTIPLQLLPGNRIATASLDYALGYYASAINEARQLNVMSLTLGWMVHFLHNSVIPWMQNSTYTPFDASTIQDAQTLVVEQLLPYVPFTLENLAPNGTAVALLQNALATMQEIQQAMEAANAAITDTPNLQ